MGRKIKLDKNARFDSETLLEKLKAKHHVAPIENAKRITSADLRNALLQRTLDKKVAKAKRKKYRYALAIIVALIIAIFLA